MAGTQEKETKIGKEIDMKMIQASSIEIREREVLRYLKFDREKTKLSDIVLSLVRRGMQEGALLVNPAGTYEKLKIKENNGASVYLGKLQVPSPQVARLLRNSEYAVLFVTTIGPKIEKRIAELFREDKPTEAVILDAVGSEAVESFTNYFVKEVNRLSAKERKTTPRFSPGYGQWDVSANKSILQLLKAGSIGVKISSKYMLTPQKTVTGIWGITRADE